MPFLRRARIRGDCGQRNYKKLELSEFSANRLKRKSEEI
jgi:hypothetical protein